EQDAGLAIDDLEIDLFGDVRVMAVHELHDLAGGDLAGGLGHDLHDAHLVDLDHQLECAAVQKVADQDACFIAPDAVSCLPSAAHVGVVDHVVVQQGGGVNEFDHGRHQG